MFAYKDFSYGQGRPLLPQMMESCKGKSKKKKKKQKQIQEEATLALVELFHRKIDEFRSAKTLRAQFNPLQRTQIEVVLFLKKMLDKEDFRLLQREYADHPILSDAAAEVVIEDIDKFMQNRKKKKELKIRKKIQKLKCQKRKLEEEGKSQVFEEDFPDAEKFKEEEEIKIEVWNPNTIYGFDPIYESLPTHQASPSMW